MIYIVDTISRFFQNRHHPEPAIPKDVKRERRKATKDRRRSVNDGVIVSLSSKGDKRSGRDRRKSP